MTQMHPLLPKYPDKGATIFSKMTALALEYQAINLSQGFPDFDIEQEIKERLSHATLHGYNQYAPMAGLPDLQNALALKNKHFQNVHTDPHEITITPGATYAIFTALATIINPGDEVIVLEPAYDSYIPNIYMNGGVPIRVSLSFPDFTIDWSEIEKVITERTKAIIINNPHNPCGTVWTSDDMSRLEKLCEKHNLYIISDEVYEHIVFDGEEHLSVLRFPNLRKRSFVIGSFGKIFHNTGWKLGFCIAPETFTTAFRKIHQYIVFSVNTPAQHAIASYILEDVSRLSMHAQMLQKKRDLFLDHLVDSPFICYKRSGGSYFQLLDYSQMSSLPDDEFAIWLTQNYGVATIPLSSFYLDAGVQHKMVRFCFSKQDETLMKATEKLKSLSVK